MGNAGDSGRSRNQSGRKRLHHSRTGRRTTYQSERQATSQSDRPAASTTITERFRQDTVTGRVNAIGPNHLSIHESNGGTIRVGVDDRTKMGRVAIGDHVKAYVSEDGYASTVQHIAD